MMMMMPTKATIIHLDSTTADVNYDDDDDDNNNNNKNYISMHMNTKLLTIPHILHNE
jgi:hypothetical protein